MRREAREHECCGLVGLRSIRVRGKSAPQGVSAANMALLTCRNSQGLRKSVLARRELALSCKVGGPLIHHLLALRKQITTAVGRLNPVGDSVG